MKLQIQLLQKIEEYKSILVKFKQKANFLYFQRMYNTRLPKYTLKFNPLKI